MDLPSWITSAIKEEVGDSKIKPEYTFKRKHNELFVGIVWKFDAQVVSHETHAKQRSIPKFSPDKKSDVSVCNVNTLSSDNASAEKKHKSPCRIRRNKRKLVELKRKIAARKLAAKPPVPTDNRPDGTSCTVAGSPVAVMKNPSIVSKGAGINPSAKNAAEDMPSELSVMSANDLNDNALRALIKLRDTAKKVMTRKEPYRQKLRLPKIHPAMPSIRHVMGHAYGCEKCQRDASDIDVNVYLCKQCSRRGKYRHICLECFEISDHTECSLTLIDFG